MNRKLAAAALTLAALPTCTSAAEPADDARLAVATFAGGCFWSMERVFDTLPGVVSTTSGYMGGETVDPTYSEVTTGGTGHAESVQVRFDAGKISYAALLDAYWHNIDPLTPDGQFCDSGPQYRTAIFYHDEEQHALAEQSEIALERSGRFRAPVVTRIVKASAFYPAEEYHQDFHEKNPLRYQLYRAGCGRDSRLLELWGSPASSSGVR